jgi:hypothetical protein
MLTPAGRISVSDKRFIVTENGMRTDYTMLDEEEYRVSLLEHFGIVM